MKKDHTVKSLFEWIGVERKKISERDFVELWNRIERRNHALDRAKIFRKIVWAASSAAACVALVAGVWLFHTGRSNTVDIASMNRLTVPLGERSELTLSDGTKLWVNAGTSVVYPAVFSGKTREIYVDGEVFAEVAHDSKRPFHIRTDKLNVVVLGTSFNVSSYKNDDENSVVLVEGSVRIETDDDTFVLKPNEKLTMQPGSLNITTVDTESYILWKEGLYQFRNEEFAVILSKLSKYYGVEMSCDATSARLVCNGKLDLKEDLTRVLKGLTMTLPVELSKNEGKYIFTYNG
jgi:ferric-dicitrate binding protein FerR (iron transport regulator)